MHFYKDLEKLPKQHMCVQWGKMSSKQINPPKIFILEESAYQSFYMSSNKCEALPVGDVWVTLVDFTPGLLSVAVAGFFRTTRPPRAPRPPRVPTLLSQLSTLARFTPAVEVSYKQAKKMYCVKKKIYFLLR